MDSASAANALAALGHQPRLEIFRLLVQAGPDGIAAGDIGRAVGAKPTTLSSILNVLSHSGLIVSRRDGRSIIYKANSENAAALIDFLVDDCCGGTDVCELSRFAATKPRAG